MNRTVSAVINGKEKTLNYSMEVMFGAIEKFGGASKALEAVQDPGKEGFEAVKWFAVQLANDGELLRREQGCEPEELLKEKDVSPRMHPLEYSELREAVLEAITLGYRRDVESHEEIDLGLAELNEKKTKPGKRSRTSPTSQ